MSLLSFIGFNLYKSKTELKILFFSNNKTRLIFLKGKNVNTEIAEAKKKFFFDHNIYKSKSTGAGFVIEVKDFKIND